MPRLIPALVLLPLFAIAAAADSGAESADSLQIRQVHELLALTGAGQMGPIILENLQQNFTRNGLELPDSTWAEIKAKADLESLDRQVVPIYLHFYTAEELAALLDFYRSPLGASALAKSPMVNQASLEVGQAWGQTVADGILQDLDAQGKLRRPGTPPLPSPAPVPETDHP